LLKTPQKYLLLLLPCNCQVWLQITSDYMKKCNRLQLITITNYDYPMSGYQCTTNVVCLNAAHGEVHSIQNYVIKVCQWFAAGQLFSSILAVTNRIGFGGPSEKTSVLINFLMQNTMLTHVRWFYDIFLPSLKGFSELFI
jgi:hypothetical protein